MMSTLRFASNSLSGIFRRRAFTGDVYGLFVEVPFGLPRPCPVADDGGL